MVLQLSPLPHPLTLPPPPPHTHTCLPACLPARQVELLKGQKLQGVLTSNEVQAILAARGWEKEYPLFTTGARGGGGGARGRGCEGAKCEGAGGRTGSGAQPPPLPLPPCAHTPADAPSLTPLPPPQPPSPPMKSTGW